VQPVVRVPLAVRKVTGQLLSLFIMQFEIQYSCTYEDASYPGRLGPSRKFVENSTELTWLEIKGYEIKCSTVV
jgi:hypothetical protein